MKTFQLSIPVVVTICAEVRARNKDHAREVANEQCTEITELFTGIGDNIQRPHSIEVSGGAWFEGTDECEFFLRATAIHQVKSTRK